MFQLPIGLAAFGLPHLWKRISPATRGRWGDPGKGVVAVLSIAGIWLMARGYGAWAEAPQVWFPAPWLRHLNNLLVLVGFYFFVAAGMGGWGARVNRHPQLTGVILWAVAHLLVNGDLASFILFGGLLVWALVEIVLLNRAGAWKRRTGPFPVRKEIMAAVGAVVVMLVVGLIHGWIGPWPFGG